MMAMFVKRTSVRSGGRQLTYLQLVESYRDGDKVRQRVVVSMDVQFPAVGGRPVSRMMFGSLVVDLGFHLSEAIASAVDIDDMAVVQ